MTTSREQDVEPNAEQAIIDPDSFSIISDHYRREYAWADSLAIQVCLRTDAASAAHNSAAFRMFQVLGIERTRGRYSVLRALYFTQGQRLSQVEIGNDIRVTSANVTHLVDGLEKEGLVKRNAHPSDRRISWIELTPAGITVCEMLIPAMADLMARLCEGFSEQEKLLFLDLLKRFKANGESLFSTPR